MSSADTTKREAQIGRRAPDFIMQNQSGEQVSLADLLGKGPIVLYFYPKDESPGCTAEACAFRDSYTVFQDAGAEVVGVSTDSVASHKQFAQKHRLPFMLLSDLDGAVQKQYGATALFGLMTGRVTYVIDKHGVIQHSFQSMFHATKHVDEAVTIIKRLQAEQA